MESRTEEVQVEEEVKVERKRRKTSPRPRGTKRPRPPLHRSVKKRYSERMKKVWRDNREVMLAAAAKRRGKGGRAGVPDGMRKPEAMAKWAEARSSAKETVQTMVEKQIISDDEKANEALETAITVMRGPSTHQKEKLSAARLVLDFTRAKPAQKSEVSITKAEDWLALVTADAVKEETQ